MILADGCEGLLFPAFLLNERRALSSMFRVQSRPEFPSSIVQIDIKATINLSVGDPAYVGPGTNSQGQRRAGACFVLATEPSTFFFMAIFAYFFRT